MCPCGSLSLSSPLLGSPLKCLRTASDSRMRVYVRGFKRVDAWPHAPVANWISPKFSQSHVHESGKERERDPVK